jgi:hypothetical protein
MQFGDRFAQYEAGRDRARFDREWTRVVNKSLHDVGRGSGHLVGCHGREDHGEWMLDLIWMD